MTHLKVTCESHLHINFHEIAYATLASPMLMTYFEVETRKFRIKSSVALCSVDSWALVHYCIVNLKFNSTTMIMFFVIIKLKSHFQLSLIPIIIEKNFSTLSECQRAA